VNYFLIRLEPYTTYSRILQGGKFDQCNRLFSSIQKTWNTCNGFNNNDYKELIPEFFYNPEFLAIQNDVFFGINDKGIFNKIKKGIALGNVILPNWAKTKEEFIYLHRQALESDYVSENLNEWIDLIFGYKQLGEEAVKNHNVFQALTYEGAVDLNKIDDEGYKSSVIGAISNFGQTPKQLLKRPHQKRQLRDTLYKPFGKVKMFNIVSTKNLSNFSLIYLKFFSNDQKINIITEDGYLISIKLSSLFNQK
jgi:hypothetical protein